MENDDGDTVLNTTFDAGSSQHHPQMPVYTSPLRYQSTPSQTDTVRMRETPVPEVPAYQTYLRCLLLCLQKTDAAPSLMTTWKYVMQKSC